MRLNFGPPVTACPPIRGYGVRLIRLCAHKHVYTIFAKNHTICGRNCVVLHHLATVFNNTNTVSKCNIMFYGYK